MVGEGVCGKICVIIADEVSGGRQRDRVLGQLREGLARGLNCCGIGSQSVLSWEARFQVLRPFQR